MGHREVRPVALGWEHPRDPGTRPDGTPRYRPLFSRADLLAHRQQNIDHPGDRDIDLAEYMPELPEGSAYGYQLYETVTEGTPSSPVFRRLEDLAGWCEGGATVYGGHRWTRQHWLESFRSGTLPSDSSPLVG